MVLTSAEVESLGGGGGEGGGGGVMFLNGY